MTDLKKIEDVRRETGFRIGAVNRELNQKASKEKVDAIERRVALLETERNNVGVMQQRQTQIEGALSQKVDQRTFDDANAQTKKVFLLSGMTHRNMKR